MSMGIQLKVLELARAYDIIRTTAYKCIGRLKDKKLERTCVRSMIYEIGKNLGLIISPFSGVRLSLE